MVIIPFLNNCFSLTKKLVCSSAIHCASHIRLDVCFKIPEMRIYFQVWYKATRKSEYLNGKIFVMPGVNLTHNFIMVDIATELIVNSQNKCTLSDPGSCGF